MDRSGLFDRLRAGAIHLCVGLAVSILGVGLAFLLWYPGELAQAQGLSRFVLAVLAVSVLVGPLLTSLVYVRGKWGLRFDLAVIAAMQAGALLFGLHAIHKDRPVFVVFNIDRFDVVAAHEVAVESLELADPLFAIERFGFKWAGAVLPEDPEKRSKMLFSSLGGGPDLPHMPEFFVPIEDLREAMIARLHSLEELRALNELDAVAWTELLSGFGLPADRLGYLPLRANGRDGAVILERLTGEILGVRLLTPRFGPSDLTVREEPSESPVPVSRPVSLDLG